MATILVCACACMYLFVCLSLCMCVRACVHAFVFVFVHADSSQFEGVAHPGDSTSDSKISGAQGLGRWCMG